ncbi:MAG: type II 3-dehydroquinate dehydratase [Bacteroidales bacterium]|nr:type II 3-dehydroquinate dehydratase [Bacteroidales bacterium]
MKRIQIINGPNLNLLGRREPGVYGSRSFEDYLEELRQRFPDVQLDYYQSNCEGALIDCIHACGFEADGIVLNAGAYTHTSIALHDALRAVPAPAVEVHISNVHTREEFRHHSYISAACRGVICGFGLDSYRLAIEGILSFSEE